MPLFAGAVAVVMAMAGHLQAALTSASPGGGTGSTLAVSSSSSMFVFYEPAPRGAPNTSPPQGGTVPDYTYEHPGGRGAIATGIPEPATALFGVALCGFAIARRRR